MSAMRNVLGSLRAALASPRVLLLAWTVVTIPALVVVVPVARRIDSALARHPGASPTVDLALDADLARSGETAVPIVGAALFVLVAFVFLAGGILRNVGTGRRTPFAEFLADCGRCFPRNARALLLGTALGLALFWGADVLRELVRERWWYDSDTGPVAVFGQQTRWLSRELLAEALDWAFGLVFLCLLLWIKAAMAWLSVRDRGSALAALGRAGARLLLHPLRTVLTVALLAGLWLGASYAIGLATAHFLEVRGQLWLGLAVGQAGVLISLLLVVAFFVAARGAMEPGDAAAASPLAAPRRAAADLPDNGIAAPSRSVSMR
jgi:hypothetical protein